MGESIVYLPKEAIYEWQRLPLFLNIKQQQTKILKLKELNLRW